MFKFENEQRSRGQSCRLSHKCSLRVVVMVATNKLLMLVVGTLLRCVGNTCAICQILLLFSVSPLFVSKLKGGSGWLGGGPAVATELRHSSATCAQRKHMLTSHMEADRGEKRSHIYNRRTPTRKKKKEKVFRCLCVHSRRRNKKKSK